MPDYQPYRPEIVQIEGVDPSPYPRPMPISTDESRAAEVQETGGEPRVDFDGTSNPYIDYQSIDLLLSLQHTRSEGYDEMAFYVMGQVKELLFRGLHFELANAQQQLDQDQVGNAVEILNRAEVFIDYLTESWSVLATITAEGFAEFRDSLGTASGQLSFMYRHVEFVLGNKSRRLAQAHRNVPHVWPAIEKALLSPSMYDSAIALLSRRGLGIDSAALERDWAEAYSPNASVEAAWRSIYQDAGNHNELYVLGEQLTAIDQQFSLYRHRHFVTVERIIGYKAGTGGSTGVAWLEAITKHRFFPELWSIRT